MGPPVRRRQRDTTPGRQDMAVRAMLERSQNLWLMAKQWTAMSSSTDRDAAASFATKPCNSVQGCEPQAPLKCPAAHPLHGEVKLGAKVRLLQDQPLRQYPRLDLNKESPLLEKLA